MVCGNVCIANKPKTIPRNNTNVFNLIQMHSHLLLDTRLPVYRAQFIELNTFVIIIAK